MCCRRRLAEQKRIVQDGDPTIVLRKSRGGGTATVDQNALVVLVREEEHLLIWRRFVDCGCRCTLHAVQEVLVAAVVRHGHGMLIVPVAVLLAAAADALRRCPAVDLSIVLLLVAVEEAHLPPLATGEQIGLLGGGHRLCGPRRLHRVRHGGGYDLILFATLSADPFQSVLRHNLIFTL